MVFVHLDEIQNITSEEVLSQLLISLGGALGHQEDITVPGGGTIRRALPIAVYLTGLPEFEERAGARHGATFARRFQTMALAPRSDADLELALAEFLEPGMQAPPTSSPLMMCGATGLRRATRQSPMWCASWSDSLPRSASSST